MPQCALRVVTVPFSARFKIPCRCKVQRDRGIRMYADVQSNCEADTALNDETWRIECVYCVSLASLILPLMTTKVLIVDDDEIVLDYLSLFVAAAGYQVVRATSGEAALASMQQDFAQIVILDVSMPCMDGLALCRAIRRQTYSEHVYIVLHTAKDTDKEILEGLDAGADDYLRKGTSKDQIIRRLRTAERILSCAASAHGEDRCSMSREE
jgi:CheY-like chemotaxis protein